MAPTPEFVDDANDTWKYIKNNMDKFSKFVTRWYGVSDSIRKSRVDLANKRDQEAKAQLTAKKIRLEQLKDRNTGKGKAQRRNIIWDEE
jgi:hypothetical protein